MAYTDHAAFYAAIRESGINRVAQLALQQRPSWFSYATAYFIAKSELLARPIDANPQVQKSGNPLISLLAPLPVVGSDGFGLDFYFQVAVGQVDFAPGNAIFLPAGLTPLGPQRLAVQLSIVGGLACPPADVLATIVGQLPPVPNTTIDLNNLTVSTVIPTTSITVFAADAYVVLGASVADQPPNETMNVVFGGMKVTGFLAPGVEAVLECYVNLVMQLTVLPRLKKIIPTTFHHSMVDPNAPHSDITLPLAFDGTFTPNSASVPNNPAIEDDQGKVYVDLKVGPA